MAMSPVAISLAESRQLVAAQRKLLLSLPKRKNDMSDKTSKKIFTKDGYQPNGYKPGGQQTQATGGRGGVKKPAEPPKKN